ncbi:MAG: AIR synthase family protein [Firmicutes bacterium]|nr:AIR synthase family protein [Bacillota bacterium]
MKIGKVPADVLEELVISPLSGQNVRREEILVRPKTGEDCSLLDCGEEKLLISADPITGACEDIGFMALQVNCNDIAACGGEPVGIMLTVLLPPGTKREELEKISSGARKAAEELGIEIIGGHTEITDAVTRPVISGAVIGKTRKGKHIPAGGAKPGDCVIMTKWAALEGSAIIASEKQEKLNGKVAPEIIKKAQTFTDMISVLPESKIGFELGATAMHDTTEGGVLGALWELAEAAGLGLECYPEKIPVLPETREICAALNIDPLRLISSGSLLIAAKSSEKILLALKEAEINAAVIAEIKDAESGRTLVFDNRREELYPPDTDELYKI